MVLSPFQIRHSFSERQEKLLQRIFSKLIDYLAAVDWNHQNTIETSLEYVMGDVYRDIRTEEWNKIWNEVERQYKQSGWRIFRIYGDDYTLQIGM